MIALKSGINPLIAKRIGFAASLHDIGKNKLPDDLLNKPGKLDENEFEVIKTHTKLGAEMLTDLHGDFGTMTRTICLYHHEWYNDCSRSYWGKYACELPAYVPIISISDVFISLCAARPYKEAWKFDDAVDYIHDNAGTQFNPVLVDIFLSLADDEKRLEAINGS